MTRKQRHLVYELVAIIAAGLMGVFAVPALFNAHDSVALLAGGILIIGWFAWMAFYLYRLTTSKGF
jgi:hypothetical protein